MAKKKNTLKELSEFLEAQQEPVVPVATDDFHAKPPTQLVEVDKVETEAASAGLYKGDKPPALTNEEAIYKAIVQLASTRKTSPEAILRRLIEMREGEMATEKEPSFTEWVSEHANSLWREFFE